MNTASRIDTTFQRLRQAGRKGLIGYLTAGDPDLETSLKDLRSAIASGIDLLELGVPFSDATADGPTIQEASQRALASGMTVGGALDIVRELRRDQELPIVLFGYANPFYRYGFERLARDAAGAGADGLLVVDMPFEESTELRRCLKAAGLAFIYLAAPTTPPDRARLMLRDATGFVYYIMVTGVTGARDDLAPDVAEHVATLRRCTSLPVAVGFGISRGEQARAAGAAADAVVVGSALIKAARDGRLAALVDELRAGLDAAAPRTGGPDGDAR